MEIDPSTTGRYFYSVIIFGNRIVWYEYGMKYVLVQCMVIGGGWLQSPASAGAPWIMDVINLHAIDASGGFIYENDLPLFKHSSGQADELTLSGTPVPSTFCNGAVKSSR